jgi:hypothetical protein
MDKLVTTKFYLQLYELIRSSADAPTAKKTVETVEGMIEQGLAQKVRENTKENDMAIRALKQKHELDLVELKNKFLRRILIGLFIALELLILGLYFVH